MESLRFVVPSLALAALLGPLTNCGGECMLTNYESQQVFWVTNALAAKLTLPDKGRLRKTVHLGSRLRRPALENAFPSPPTYGEAAKTLHFLTRVFLGAPPDKVYAPMKWSRFSEGFRRECILADGPNSLPQKWRWSSFGRFLVVPVVLARPFCPTTWQYNTARHLANGLHCSLLRSDLLWG